MIPQDIYNHVKYGSPGNPQASIRSEDKKTLYVLRRENGYVVCDRYQGKESPKRIKLSLVPDRPASEWDWYFINEC